MEVSYQSHVTATSAPVKGSAANRSSYLLTYLLTYLLHAAQSFLRS